MQPMTTVIIECVIAILLLAPTYESSPERYHFKSEYRAMIIDANSLPLVSIEGIAGNSAIAGAPTVEPINIQLERLNHTVPDGRSKITTEWSFSARLANSGNVPLHIPLDQGRKSDLLRKCADNKLQTLDLSLVGAGKPLPFTQLVLTSYGCGAVKDSQIILQPGEWISITGSMPSSGSQVAGQFSVRMLADLHEETYTRTVGGWRERSGNAILAWSRDLSFP